MIIQGTSGFGLGNPLQEEGVEDSKIAFMIILCFHKYRSSTVSKYIFKGRKSYFVHLKRKQVESHTRPISVVQEQ